MTIALKFIAVSMVFFTASACITNIDKPPPNWWTYFSGNGSSEKNIRMALLECGSALPGDPLEFGIRENSDYDRLKLTTRCMINSGYPFSGRGCSTSEGVKGDKSYTPACDPSATIPKRSAATRLNSRYCADYPKSQYCQP